MTDYYVAGDGNNSDGLNWTKAFTTFAGAVSAATGDGDVIYVDQGLTDVLSGDTTYTFGNNVRVICSNDKVNTPPQTLGSMGTTGYIGHTTSKYNITLAGAYKVFIYGLTFRCGGATSWSFTINNTDAGNFELENCYFWCGSTSASSLYNLNAQGATQNNFTKIKDSTFRFGNTGASILPSANVELIGCTISASGSTPATLFGTTSRPTVVISEACDWSLPGTALVASQGTVYTRFIFINCKVNASLTSVLATQTPANRGSAEAFLFNCSGTTQYYHIAHHNAFGSTICDTGIYANDGASYDGTNRLSWKIVTTANCSYYTPYVSPWIDCYHSGTSAINPSLEILRSSGTSEGTTAYQDNEVWYELSYQGTDNTTLALIVNDRKPLLDASPNDQTAGVGLSGWTGEGAYAWSGKLDLTGQSSTTITPYEIGHLRARVCVGKTEATVYVDPQIRGRS